MKQSSSRLIKGNMDNKKVVPSDWKLPEFSKPDSSPGLTSFSPAALPDLAVNQNSQSNPIPPIMAQNPARHFSRSSVIRGQQTQSMVNGWAVPILKSEIPQRPSKTSRPNMTEDFTNVLNRANEQAVEIIEEARLSAEKILEEAAKDVESKRQQGFMEGMTAAKLEASQSLKQVERVYQELQLWQEQVMNQSQKRIMEMIVEIGRKLFGDGFELPAEQLDHIVSRAINEASRLGDLRIYMHPEDAKILVNLWQESEITVNGQQIQIVSSQNISRGGCFVDGQFGIVDGRVEEQMEQIAETIRPTATKLELEEL